MKILGFAAFLVVAIACAPAGAQSWSDVNTNSLVVEIDWLDLGSDTYAWDVTFLGGGPAAGVADNQVAMDRFFVWGPDADFTAASSEVDWKSKKGPNWALAYLAQGDPIRRDGSDASYRFQASFDAPIDPSKAAIHMRYGERSDWFTGGVSTPEPSVFVLLAIGLPIAVVAGRRRTRGA